MTPRQYLLPIASEIIVDLFAGGGGASTGIEQATGRHVDVAINHDPEAIALHEINHPQTQHYVSDVFEVNPHVATGGRPVGLLWASPDCKHFSKAKGGKRCDSGGFEAMRYAPREVEKFLPKSSIVSIKWMRHWFRGGYNWICFMKEGS